MNVEQAASVLTSERSKLVRQLADMGANERGELTGEVEYGEGFADAAASTAERSEVLGIVGNLHRMLVSVDAALAKVEAGTYGQCESCGNQIDDDRLEFRPTSRFCVECKSKRH
ncbi:MAG: TraR/DksA C4-type zinc finger protein [Acidimicrobiia bacterium]